MDSAAEELSPGTRRAAEDGRGRRKRPAAEWEEEQLKEDPIPQVSNDTPAIAPKGLTGPRDDAGDPTFSLSSSSSFDDGDDGGISISDDGETKTKRSGKFNRRSDDQADARSSSKIADEKLLLLLGGGEDYAASLELQERLYAVDHESRMLRHVVHALRSCDEDEVRSILDMMRSGRRKSVEEVERYVRQRHDDESDDDDDAK